jgi:branched-chain amino acid aminotransferase
MAGSSWRPRWSSPTATDRSFNLGNGCFDMTRTFDGRIFRLAEHVDRLYRSLRYLAIDVDLERERR